MKKDDNTYGLVIAGGQSQRMGHDKAWIRYHGKPQLYHVFDQLSCFCPQVFISCNRLQKKRIFNYYPAFTDRRVFEESGPIAALLTAFHHHPGKDFLVTASDYPLLTTATISAFFNSIIPQRTAAFFNPVERCYEPLIAYYPSSISVPLMESFNRKKYSLQQFLQEQDAMQFIPGNLAEITNVNTPEQLGKILEYLKQQQSPDKEYKLLSSRAALNTLRESHGYLQQHNTESI